MMKKGTSERLKHAIRILERLSQELNRLPSSDECIERLRASPRFANMEELRLKPFVDQWSRLRVRLDSIREAEQKQRQRKKKARLRARLKKRLRKPKGNFRRCLTNIVRRSEGIDDLIAQVSRIHEFSGFTSKEVGNFARKELLSLLRKEKDRALLRQQKKKAGQILKGLSLELNRMPSNAEFIARMRESLDFSRISMGRLKALIEHATRARQKKLSSRVRHVIEKLSQDLNRTPTVNECVLWIREDSEIAYMEAEHLESLVEKAVQTLAQRKAGAKRRRKIRAKRRRQKGGDAMNRAIFTGFETNRRRH